jgi:hypothetical protein
MQDHSTLARTGPDLKSQICCSGHPFLSQVVRHRGRISTVAALRSDITVAKEESMRVLVTGATGNVGRIVVEQLLAAGVRVRAMTRRPQHAQFPDAVETVAGDLADPAALAPVLSEVDRMYLFPVASTTRSRARRQPSEPTHSAAVARGDRRCTNKCAVPLRVCS